MKHRFLLLSLAAMTLLGSCSKEDTSTPEGNTPQGEFVSVTLPMLLAETVDTPPSAMSESRAASAAPSEGFSVSFAEAPAPGEANAATRAATAPAPATAPAAEAPAAEAPAANTPSTRAIAQVLSNVWVLQFDKTGANVSTTNTGTLSAGAYLTAPSLQVGTGYTIYIVANGVASGLTTSNPATLADFEAKMLHTTAVTDATKLPMSGKLTGVAVVNMGGGTGKISIPDAAPVRVELKRIHAEVTLTVDFGVTDYTLTGAQLYNVPVGATYSWDSATTTFPDNTVASNFGYRFTASAGMPSLTASTSGSKTTYKWFVGDNRRGEVAGLTAQTDRNRTKAPTYATFARITLTNNTIYSKKLFYDVYLGSGAVTNFDIKRNTTYTQTATIKGSAAFHEALVGVDLRVSGPRLLTVDANGILVLKSASETRGQMMFFKFGSVVGFTQEGDWDEDKVLFNPVTNTPTYANYTSIPVYTSDDYNANRKDISDPAYHTGANIKLGKGDPCKLVGLTAMQIQSMTAAELDAYNSGWRLPTPDEQCSFTGQTADASYSAHWIASDSRYDKWYYSTGSAGGYFPKGQESQKLNYLPAAGNRLDTSGSTSYVGSGSYYWSSTAYSGTSGYSLFFGSTNVNPLSLFNSSYGFGVRCVEEPVLEVDANGILVLRKVSETRGKMMFFQFGSVVGFTQEGAWAADKVLFNPVTNTPTYANYTSIPVYTSDDYNANRKDISDPAYHTGANIKAGKGDPCKLVGLSAKKIQWMTAAQLDAYNSGWRLPTSDEQCTFTGQTTTVDYSAHWIASDSRYDKWYYSTGSAGGYFPKGQESQKKNYLPAAGYRNYTDGSPTQVGVYGYYWSSTVAAANGYNLHFTSWRVAPLSSYIYSHGFGVRCVLR